MSSVGVISVQIQHLDTDLEKKKTQSREWEITTATLNAVMQMFSHLRAVEDLEPLPLSEAEVILSPGLIVVKSHKQSHPCRESDTCWLELK